MVDLGLSRQLSKFCSISITLVETSLVPSPPPQVETRLYLSHSSLTGVYSLTEGSNGFFLYPTTQYGYWPMGPWSTITQCCFTTESGSCVEWRQFQSGPPFCWIYTTECKHRGRYGLILILHPPNLQMWNLLRLTPNGFHKGQSLLTKVLKVHKNVSHDQGFIWGGGGRGQIPSLLESCPTLEVGLAMHV